MLIETSPVFHSSRAGRPDLLAQPARSLDMARLGETLTDPTLAPPIKGTMVWGTNPVVTQPDARRVRRGLLREDLFTVVVEHVLTDTAAYADIVLPSTTQLEHFDVQGAWGHHYVSVNHPAVPPLGEAKSHGEIMRLLARGMGLAHPALRESDEEIAASALPDGMDLGTLKAAGWIKRSPTRPVPGAAAKLSLCGGVPLPISPPSSSLLQLLTPKGHFFLNTTFADMARQRRSMGPPTLEIGREDAERCTAGWWRWQASGGAQTLATVQTSTTSPRPLGPPPGSRPTTKPLLKSGPHQPRCKRSCLAKQGVLVAQLTT